MNKNLFNKDDYNLILFSFYSFLIILIPTIIYYGNFETFLFYFANYGDNIEYIEQTKKIFDENYVQPDNLGTLKSPFGLSFIIYIISKLFFVTYTVSFFIISILIFFLSIFLTSKLFNHNTSYAFIIIGYEFNIGGIYGGSQNLALFLVLFSFLLIRNNYFILAVLFASLSYFVRPLCIAAPISFLKSATTYLL